MNTSRYIEIRTDLHNANLEMKACLQSSAVAAAEANIACRNVDAVKATWGDDSDMVEMAQIQRVNADRRLISANHATTAAIETVNALSEALAQFHQGEHRVAA